MRRKVFKKSNQYWKNKRKFKHKTLRSLQKDKGKYFANDINENNIYSNINDYLSNKFFETRNFKVLIRKFDKIREKDITRVNPDHITESDDIFDKLEDSLSKHNS